jgi:uncharacterized protein YoxC
LLVAARSSFYMPMMLGSVTAQMLNAGTSTHISIAGFSLVLGAGIGRKVIKDEKQRQRTYRQQQAKAAVRKFVDEVAFVMNKETRDSLRVTQRQLRDDFQGRALQLQRSALEAMEAARHVAELNEQERRVRERELSKREDRLEEVRTAVREVVTARG